MTFIKPLLALILFVYAFSVVNGLNLKYVKNVVNKKVEISGRFIQKDVNMWYFTAGEAFRYLIKNKHYDNWTVPMFRDNKFVIRYGLLNEPTVLGKIGKKWTIEKVKWVTEAHGAIEQNSCLYFWKIDTLSHLNQYTGKPYIVYDMALHPCGSAVGLQKTKEGNEQFLPIATAECKEGGAILHETMHALGFMHEFQRPDRDDYISVDYGNLHRGKWDQFQIQSPIKFNLMAKRNFSTGDFVYDYRSVMNYRPLETKAAIIDKKPAFTPVCNFPIKEIGRYLELSKGDIQLLQFHYGCDRYKHLIDAYKGIEKYRYLFYNSYDVSHGYKDDPFSGKK